MKITTEQVIKVEDFNTLVENTYSRPYDLQQQDGCMDRQLLRVTVPEECDDYDNTTVEEPVTSDEMGVSFEAWKNRDPGEKLASSDVYSKWEVELWFRRKFYPELQMLLNDLYKKGLLASGDYTIEIDW